MTKKIMIDPGCVHHNTDGCLESIEMMGLSNYLRAVLKQCGLEADLTHIENESPDPTSRGRRASGCDLFISECSHLGDWKGCECYYPVSIPEDKDFASDLAAAVSEEMGNLSWGTKTWSSEKEENDDRLGVIGYAVTIGCPHVFLFANGFHDTGMQNVVSKTDGKFRRVAQAQARVICHHLGISYREPKTDDSFVTANIGLLSDRWHRQGGEATGVRRYTEKNAKSAAAKKTGRFNAGKCKVGDKVHIRDSVLFFADGAAIASFIRDKPMYVLYIGVGKVLIGTKEDSPITGWVKEGDILRCSEEFG